MNIKEWKEKIKDLKKGKQTGSLPLKLKSYIGTNIKEIYEEREVKKCRCCGTLLGGENGKRLNICFNEKQENLTIFQAELLFMIFVLGVIPYDYFKYHECRAGKEFIKNIKEIKLLI